MVVCLLVGHLFISVHVSMSDHMLIELFGSGKHAIADLTLETSCLTRLTHHLQITWWIWPSKVDCCHTRWIYRRHLTTIRTTLQNNKSKRRLLVGFVIHSRLCSRRRGLAYMRNTKRRVKLSKL